MMLCILPGSFDVLLSDQPGSVVSRFGDDALVSFSSRVSSQLGVGIAVVELGADKLALSVDEPMSRRRVPME